ncbi:hypothetical protein [Pseudonocardia sp.]|uniref:hypothetical protein n=1 Tax=Pseudonocardia sp. TaxID=60912 RepID=UPI003D0E4A75
MRTSLLVAVLAALLLAGCGGVGTPAQPPAQPPTADAFAGVPATGPDGPPGFVGRDAAGVGLAVRLTGPQTAVAYLCDGAGTGRWYTGPVAADGTLRLTAADGEVLTAAPAGAGLTGTHGDGVAFTLEPAQPGSGLFRQTLAGTSFVAGWVVGNDGSVLGRAKDDGGGVVTVSSPGDDEPAADTGEAVTGSGGAPEPAVRRVRCGLLNFRIGFNEGQFQSAEPGSQAEADARGDRDRLVKRNTDLGCGDFAAGPTS